MHSAILPISAFREHIVETVRHNPITIITAETGAGKSTQVPQYLLEAGYDMIVTQPRRIAAEALARRVSEEMGEYLGKTIGFRTAVSRMDSPLTRCLFCTDGLALVRELMGLHKGILILDEIHEWNENMEVLVAWTLLQIKSGVDFKVVLMSATLETARLSAFFNNAPIISIPGNSFPVEIQKPGAQIIDDVAQLVLKGRNVLVFQPGTQEIADTCNALAKMQVDAEILQLHGQLMTEEQAKCFMHYARPKVIVSTKVAQTSITIDDIDAVVDSGMEKRIELEEGVEGLYLRTISRADALQRKGRAGRTKEGIYIDHCSTQTRSDFTCAEIMRTRLDQTVLRLASIGIDMEKVDFFHQPNKLDIHMARQTLIRLGCMTQSGEVTTMGKLVNSMPISVQYARMLIEADRLHVMDDVLTITAIFEVGGITTPPPNRKNPDRPDWRHLVPNERDSDALGLLAIWNIAEKMTRDEMSRRGISFLKYSRAKEIRTRLEETIAPHFVFGTTGCRENILKSICAGMVDNLYKVSYGICQNTDGDKREISTHSLVRNAVWVVGKPFNLEVKTRRGSRVIKLLDIPSKINPLWLTEVAPQLVVQKVGCDPRYNSHSDTVVSTTQTFFRGHIVMEEVVDDVTHPDASLVFAHWILARFPDASPKKQKKK